MANLPSTQISGHKTKIHGLLIFDVTYIGDERGYYQELFNKEKLVSEGFPQSFNVIQNNISYNKNVGVTRGLHAEPWDKYKIVLNAAAFTNVDGAETNVGRIAAWKVNAASVGYLVAECTKHNLTLVHISTDYVFDGTKALHTEDEQFSPLSVYGSSKAAGDIAVTTLPKYYILRTSWVIVEDKNFVRTMLDIGDLGINPSVVNDQVGRLTFTSELVRAIDHLLTNNAPFGTYNISNDGKPSSWADITSSIFSFAVLTNTVREQSTEDYYRSKDKTAPRPLNSTLDISKIQQTDFSPNDWETELKNYLNKELAKKL